MPNESTPVVAPSHSRKSGRRRRWRIAVPIRLIRHRPERPANRRAGVPDHDHYPFEPRF